MRLTKNVNEKVNECETKGGGMRRWLIVLLVAQSLWAQDYRILGVLQTKFTLHDSFNEFSLGKTSLGIDGDIAKGFGYRFLISLGKDFKYSAFDVYGRYRFRQGEIRFGQFKPPFSMERLISFPKRDFIDNAIITRIVPARDMGVGLFYKLKWAEINFALINGEGLNKEEINKFKDIIVRFVPRYRYIRAGFAIYYGKAGEDTAVPKERYNFQFEIKSPFTLRNEIIYTRDDETKGLGYYVSCGYRIRRFEPVIRYEYYDPDRENTGDSEKKLTFGFNYYIKGYNLRLQGNYILLEKGEKSWQTFTKILFQIML